MSRAESSMALGERLLALALFVCCGIPAAAQDADSSTDVRMPAVTESPENSVTDSTVAAPSDAPELIAAPSRAGEINFLELLIQGGVFMIPLLIMSLLAVTFTLERWIGLRRSRVLPRRLVAALGQLGSATGGFDTRKAHKICQQYPSSAATVVRAMLLKVGRPHGELEHSVQETSQREAERLYSNVRWLNLCAAVAPLLGLLGTVWGMIIAFHDLTVLTPDQNKAEFLAKGIYIALVTTLGGLMVAIPAAIASHYFEGRIQTLFHQIDEMVFSVLPQVERFEGRARSGKQPADGETETTSVPIAPPPIVARGTELAPGKAPASK